MAQAHFPKALLEADLQQLDGEPRSLDDVCGGESNPEDELLLEEEKLTAERALSRLLMVADADERKLIEAWRREFLLSPKVSLNEVAFLAFRRKPSPSSPYR
jgi:hypothetical protein